MPVPYPSKIGFVKFSGERRALETPRVPLHVIVPGLAAGERFGGDVEANQVFDAVLAPLAQITTFSDSEVEDGQRFLRIPHGALDGVNNAAWKVKRVISLQRGTN